MSLFEKIAENNFEENKLFSADFANDSNPKKVNASIGLIFNEDGKLQELSFIKDVEKELYNKNLDKEYATLTGLVAFNKTILELIFPGVDKSTGQFISAQSATGGSALKSVSDIIRVHINNTIYVSDPTFSLYYNLFSKSEIKTYPYYNSKEKKLDFEALINFFKDLPDSSIISLQLSSHNPTGLDFSKEQWEVLAEIFAEKSHFAFFDAAYLGYGSNSIEGDLYPVHLFHKKEIELIVAYSSGKDFMHYCEDTGAVIGWFREKGAANLFENHLKIINRSIYSFSSLQQARVIDLILTEKRKVWEDELEKTAVGISEKRNLIIEKLLEKGLDKEKNESLLKMLKSQRGLYMFFDFDSNQVESLKKEKSIYICGGGRVNLTSINKSNIDYFCEGLVSILK